MHAQNPNRFVLTSATQNIHLDSWSLTSEEVSFTSSSKWAVRKRTLHGGRQESVDLIILDNGALTITLIPTRGMSVFEVRRGEMRLGWESPIKEIVHPQFINLESRNGLGWLEGFNEWLVRCGLEFAGHPGTDEFITNTGDKAEMRLTLHGKIGNIPASEVEVSIDPAPPHRIRVVGLVQEKVFHGPKLELRAEISTEPGSETFQIKDTIVNRSAHAQEFQIIYHANYGAPLLTANAQLVAPVRSVTPMNAHAAKAVTRYDTYAEPQPGFIEEVFLLDPIGDAQDNVLCLLKNAEGTSAASLRWNKSQLPYFTQWKNTAAQSDGYVTGLEPGTGYPFNRRVERRFGRVPKLAPGQSREFVLEFGLHDDATTIKEITEEIKKTQGKIPTERIKFPPELQKTP